MKNSYVSSLILIAAMITIFSACSQKITDQRASISKLNEFDQLTSWMNGHFNSEAQSLKDTNYYNISLIMKSIWTDRKDGHWLYVEQALASRKDKPYRQRVYHLVKTGNGTFESRIYTLTDPLRFAGVWKEDEPLAQLSPDSLTVREGCTVFLKSSKDGIIRGGTNEKDCISTLRGAAYATTEVEISPNQIISWDQGFDDTGTQVWGAENGGYVFDKVKETNSD